MCRNCNRVSIDGSTLTYTSYTEPTIIPRFKKGDKVKATRACSGAVAGQIYEVEKPSFSLNGIALRGTSCSCLIGWELVEELQTNKKTTIMKTLKGLMSRLLDKETQTLYKADFINGDLELTEKGKKQLMELLFLANKVELVKQAEAELAEAEKK